MALMLMNKHDLSPVESVYASDEEGEVRAAVGGAEDEALGALAIDVLNAARTRGIWPGCDCGSETGWRPPLVPCHNHKRTDFLNVLSARQVSHEENLKIVKDIGSAHKVDDNISASGLHGPVASVMCAGGRVRG